MSGIGILILAAGASTRLGQPKQLLSYHGQPLIRQMAEVAICALLLTHHALQTLFSLRYRV
jgi:molybdenum cofactor cytidylyltransferase